jgi:hypothetical protein
MPPDTNHTIHHHTSFPSTWLHKSVEQAAVAGVERPLWQFEAKPWRQLRQVSCLPALIVRVSGSAAIKAAVQAATAAADVAGCDGSVEDGPSQLMEQLQIVHQLMRDVTAATPGKYAASSPCMGVDWLDGGGTTALAGELDLRELCGGQQANNSLMKQTCDAQTVA